MLDPALVQAQSVQRPRVSKVPGRGATERKLYFPEGRWRHWWTGEVYEGPAWDTVPAPIGEVPLFVLEGKVVPLFDSEIDTLVKEDRDDVNGWDDANSSMQLMFYGTGKDELKLWDGTIVSCRADVPGEGRCEVDGAPVTRTYSLTFE